MNKYIVPYSIIDRDSTKIKVINARSIQECEEKFMAFIADYLDSDDWDDWNEFKQDLLEHNIIVGEIYDIEEL